MLLSVSLSLGLMTSSGHRLRGAARHTDRARQPSFLAAAASSSDFVPKVTADDVEFPEEVGPIDQAQRAVSFGMQAGPIVASYLGLFGVLQFRERVLGECLSDDACTLLWEDEHDRGSKALTEAILDLKGFYVKLGQLIASREDLFPKRYTEAMELAGVTDSHDPMAAQLVRAIISQVHAPLGRAGRTGE